jgi:PAS domain S-box-containing protein
VTETEENRLAGGRVGDFSGVVSKHTADGVCFYASPACRDLLGYEPCDLVGRSLRELVHPEDRAGVERFYSKLAASQNAGVVSYRALREDGTPVRLETTGWAMPDPDTGDVGEIVTVSRGAVSPGGSPGGGVPRVPAQETAERRHRAEDALREGGEMYRTVVEHVAENIFVVDVETGRILEANAAFSESLGYGPQETRNLTLYDVVAHDRESIDRNIRLVLERGSLDVGERRYRRADGTLVDVEVKVSVIRYRRGRALCVVAHDVTERKRVEERLLRSEAGLANAQRITHLGNWEWDLVKGEACWSDELYRIYGYAPQEFEPPATTFIDHVHPDDRARVERANLEALGGGEPYDLEHRIFRPDGSERVVHCQAEVRFDRSGEAVRVVGTVQDITERRRTEEELRTSHALLSAVVEGIPDAVFVKDLGGRYLLVNGVAAGTIRGPGAAAEDIIGRDDTEFFSPEVAEALMELDQLIVETGEVRVAEELVPLDGEDKVYLSTKAPCRDHRGEIIGVIGVSTDITEIKEVEKALFDVREAERGRIARDLHDTVLHHLVGVLQTMQASQIEDPKARGELAWQVEALREAIQGLRNAIYNLRPERTAPFVRTIESLVELNRHLAPDCEFVVRAADGLSREPFETAKVDLVRIVQEALTNARRHSGAGKVEVRLETDADGEFLAEVADDGRGLDPETDLDGVGLSAMRERALVMGARLVIASVPGGGTRVRVSVPDREPGGAPGRRPGPRG